MIMREGDDGPFNHHFTTGQQMARGRMQYKIAAVIAGFLFYALHAVAIKSPLRQNKSDIRWKRSHFPCMNIGELTTAPDMRMATLADADIA